MVRLFGSFAAGAPGSSVFPATTARGTSFGRAFAGSIVGRNISFATRNAAPPRTSNHATGRTRVWPANTIATTRKTACRRRQAFKTGCSLRLFFPPRLYAAIALDQVEEAECGVITSRIAAALAERARRYPQVLFWGRQPPPDPAVPQYDHQAEPIRGRGLGKPAANGNGRSAGRLAEAVMQLPRPYRCGGRCHPGASGMLVSHLEPMLVPGVRVEGPVDPTVRWGQRHGRHRFLARLCVLRCLRQPWWVRWWPRLRSSSLPPLGSSSRRAYSGWHFGRNSREGASDKNGLVRAALVAKAATVNYNGS